MTKRGVTQGFPPLPASDGYLPVGTRRRSSSKKFWRNTTVCSARGALCRSLGRQHRDAAVGGHIPLPWPPSLSIFTRGLSAAKESP